MAEIEALRARAMASMPVSARRHRLPLPDDKEEGELSSSSDKETPNGATGEVGNCGSGRTEVLDPERRKLDSSAALNSGKSGPFNAAPISSDVQPHNQPPPKHNSHVTSGWHRPPRGDDNLVIDFSDGSDGDSHESGHAGTTDFNNKVNAFGVDARKKLEPLQRIKSKTSLQVGKTQSRTMPKHIAASRTFASAVSKLTGQHSGPSRASSYGRGTQVLKMKSQSKYLGCQKPHYNRGINSTSKELESLRQQIALKENELKHQLRAVPPGKETPSGSDGEPYNLKEENIEKPKVARPIRLGMEANELENKRQKTGVNSHDKVDSELRKKSVLGLQKKKDDRQSMKTFTEAGASCKDIHSSNMLNERVKLSQISMPDDNIRHEIFVPKKQIPLGLSQLNKIDKAHEPDASSHHDLSRNNRDAIVSSDEKHQLASPTPHDVPSHGRNLPNLEDFSLYTKNNAMDIQGLLNFEELQDKKLEEAQELRRKCELEERTALKAYRLAQRALIDANEKCSHLYRERELFSAQIRACIMENSCSLWPFTRQRRDESWPVSFGSVSGFDVNFLPSSSCQIKNGALDQMGNYADSQFAGHDLAGTFFKCNPELACKPSISTLEPSLLDDRNAVCSTGNMGIVSAIKPVTLLPSERISQSTLVSNDAEAHKGGMSLKDQVENSIETVQNSALLESSAKSQAFAPLGERSLPKEANQELMTSSCEEHNQDGSLLEVSLRNELFARLEMRNLTDKSGLINGKKNLDCEAGQMIVELDKTDAVTHDPSFLSNEELLVGDKHQRADEKGVRAAPYIHVHGDYKTLISDDGSSQSSGHEESSIRGESHNPLPSVLHLPSSNIKVVYKHFQKHDVLGSCKKILFSKESIRDVHSTTEAPNILLKKDDSLYSLDGIHVDPFWPLCMFELRGKCNSDQCPWQHFRDSSGRESGQSLFSGSSDCHVPSSSAGGECEYACGSCHCPHWYIMPIPTYRIGSCLVKAEPTSSRYIRSVWQYGRMGFCNSCGTPIVVSRSFPPDSFVLSSGVCRIEDHEKWSKSSLLHQTIEDRVAQQMHYSNDCEQSLELALEYFISNTNRKEGRKKALAVLSRSIEADPNSVVLWVSYLHIFFEKEKTLGEDDMFLHAIQHNQGSYELWIMYINSRIEYQSCLDAYETAVKSFILLARSSVKEFRETSACLLDLTLHMIDFLRMSGNVDKAISFVEGLLPSTVELASSGKTTASDVVACLNVCDKCILLICCVYLLIYKKLPEVVLERLNFEQQLPFDMEWPLIHLTDEEKQSAVELMGVTVNIENLGASSGEEWELEGATRPKHFLALSHVKFIMMIEDLEHGKHTLYKYMRLYPFCIELSLMCARMQEERSTEVDGLKGFEEVLQSWPKKVPGFHCVWNQYLEFALENGMTSLAKKLIIRWFCALGEVRNYHGQVSDSDGSSETSYPAEPNSQSYAPQRDELFRLLNLSLYQHLNSKEVESLETVDEALSFSSEEDFAHCAREHAASKLWKSLEPLEDIIALLLNYIMDHRAASTSSIEPLSRRFISSIRKPRIRYLVNKLLGPSSSSARTRLMNSVLEVLYGPYLIPEKFSAQSFVDFVDGLMQIHPANYELALSVCKVVLRTDWAGSSSTSMIFWAGSVLVNSIFQDFPIAPEHIWVEAIYVLGKLGIRVILERFYEFALSVYPFSVNLWQSYIDFSKVGGSVSTILETAEERGITSKLHTDVEV